MIRKVLIRHTYFKSVFIKGPSPTMDIQPTCDWWLRTKSEL